MRKPVVSGREPMISSSGPRLMEVYLLYADRLVPEVLIKVSARP